MSKLLPIQPKNQSVEVENSLATIIESTVVLKKSLFDFKKFFADRVKTDKKEVQVEKRQTFLQLQQKERDKKERTLEKNTKPKNAGSGLVGKAGAAGGSLLDKLLGAGVMLALGWLIKWLPSIIDKVTLFFENLGNLLNSVKNVVVAIGDTMKSVVGVVIQTLDNWRNFDFFDSEGKLKEKMDELNSNWDKVGKEWDQTTKDFSKLRDDAMAPLETQEQRAASRNIAGVESGDLFDIIAAGEGGYNSVNQGIAGDTPGGAKSVVGKDLTDMTVAEVMAAQDAGQLFAVGKYQIIPITMKGFVRNSPDKIDLNDKFDSATQEKFKRYVMDVKRPAVGRYIRGESSDRTEAAQELSREFASIGLARPEAGRQRGESRYSGTGGNRASISPESIEGALDRARRGVSGRKATTQAPGGVGPVLTPQQATSSPNSLGLVNPTPKTNLKTQKGGYAADTGLDIHGNIGDPIVAPASGILEYAEEGHTAQANQDSNPNKPGFQPQHSFRIKLDNPFTMGGKTVRFIYGTHLETLDPAVANRSGIKIRAGQLLGTMGVANNVPHLHLGLVGDRAQTEFLNFKEVDSALGGRFSSSPSAVATPAPSVAPVRQTMASQNGVTVAVVNVPQPIPARRRSQSAMSVGGGSEAPETTLNRIAKVLLAYT